MKVLIVGGMHGNETLGLKIIELLEQKPIADVGVVVGNPSAVEANSRFTGTDLNRSFPGSANETYEQKQAAGLLKLAKKYDIVLDFHNTYCPENDCGFVGEDAPKNLFDAAWLLGLDKIVVADYDCINKYAPNCLSVEVSLSSELNSAEIWYQRILMLSRLKEVKVDAKVELYKFVYRMTIEDRDRSDLPGQKLKAFKEIDPGLAESMGVSSPAYPIFIGDTYTPYNYGGLLNKV